MVKIIRYLYQKFLIASKVRQLKVQEAGYDKEKMPYVTLENGFTFYGPKPAKKEKKFYDLFLKSASKKMLPFDCFQIAMDIVVRYQEGNLKWGGPAKEAFYQTSQGDVIAEMGAFRGYYTLYLSQKVGRNGKIIAIEPIPENVKYLKKNIEENNIENVEIVEKGVWNENDKKMFQRKPTDYQSGSIDITYSNQDALEVEVNKLDTILSSCSVEKVDFMLIQLNGAEFEALEGLTMQKPLNLAIAARYDKEGRNISSEIAVLLKQRGYNTQTLQKKFIYAQLD